MLAIEANKDLAELATAIVLANNFDNTCAQALLLRTPCWFGWGGLIAAR